MSYLKYEAEIATRYHCPAESIFDYIKWIFYSYKYWRKKKI